MNAVGELARARGERLLGAVHIQRQANDDLIRLPLFEQAFDQVPVRRTVLRFNRGQGARCTGYSLTNRHADTFGTKIKGQ
ncbi:hypothetical protein SDC9_179251 [bioreactor metagenome]|uniref:Uncharacterized protein n=1 Tax=bioreactor metagenome TaxID=1076179 RepID=A0A645GZX3_9ZZZZ